jgi:hypothetical protein
MDWHAFAKRLLLGYGNRVGAAQAEAARQAVFADGKVSADEFRFLLEVREEAKTVAPEFAKLIHDIVEHVVLRDRKIDADEVRWLRTTFLHNHPPPAEDLQFLRRLEEKAVLVCPEFLGMMQEFEGADRTEVHRQP